LEKASEVIKSNRHPNTPTPAKPCPQGPHPDGVWTPPGMGTPPLPWAAWPKAWLITSILSNSRCESSLSYPQRCSN